MSRFCEKPSAKKSKLVPIEKQHSSMDDRAESNCLSTERGNGTVPVGHFFPGKIHLIVKKN